MPDVDRFWVQCSATYPSFAAAVCDLREGHRERHFSQHGGTRYTWNGEPPRDALAVDYAALVGEHRQLADRLRQVAAERDVWHEQATALFRSQTRVLDLCDGEEAGADRLGHPTPRWVTAVRVAALLADPEPEAEVPGA